MQILTRNTWKIMTKIIELSKGNNKKKIERSKMSWWVWLMTKFIALRPKAYSHKTRKLEFEVYRNCLEATQIENNTNELDNK